MNKDNLNSKYALSKRAINKLQAEQFEVFLSVLSCFCLKTGCQHARLECFCATVVVRANTSGKDCGGNCPICSGDHNRQCLPISKGSVTNFLQCSFGLSDVAMVDGLLELV